MAQKGLVIVHTGNGKGEDDRRPGARPARCGARAEGLHGAVHQGVLEVRGAQGPEFLPGFEILPMGRGFVDLGAAEPNPEGVSLARDTLAAAREKVLSGQYGMVILDEVNYAVAYRPIDVDAVLQLIREKPEGVHLVLTGRDARPEVIEAADLVTEMREIKHPFQKGIKAQRGVEF